MKDAVDTIPDTNYPIACIAKSGFCEDTTPDV